MAAPRAVPTPFDGVLTESQWHQAILQDELRKVKVQEQYDVGEVDHDRCNLLRAKLVAVGLPTFTPAPALHRNGVVDQTRLTKIEDRDKLVTDLARCNMILAMHPNSSPSTPVDGLTEVQRGKQRARDQTPPAEDSYPTPDDQSPSKRLKHDRNTPGSSSKPSLEVPRIPQPNESHRLHRAAVPDRLRPQGDNGILRPVVAGGSEETKKRPSNSTRGQGSIYVTPRNPMDMRLSEEEVLSLLGYVVVRKGPESTVRLRDKPLFLVDDVSLKGRAGLESMLDISARMKKRNDLEGIEVSGWIKDRECEDQDGGYDEDAVASTAPCTETQYAGAGAFELLLVSSDLMHVSVVAHRGKWGMRIESKLALYILRTARDDFDLGDVRLLVNLVAYYSEGRAVPWSKREDMPSELKNVHHHFDESLVHPCYAVDVAHDTKLTSSILDMLHETVRAKTFLPPLLYESLLHHTNVSRVTTTIDSFDHAAAKERRVARLAVLQSSRDAVKGWSRREECVVTPPPRSRRKLERNDVYAALEIDGILYSAGDHVLVAGNNHAPWFARVCYFELVGKAYLVHVDYFSDRSDLWFNPPDESSLMLYTAEHCDSTGINHLVGKVDIQRVQPGTLRNEGVYHYWAHADQTQLSVVDVDSLEQPPTTGDASTEELCACCWREEQSKSFDKVQVVPSGFKLQGVVYHLHDTVYLPPDGTLSKLYRLGQIVEIRLEGRLDASTVVVRFFDRHYRHEPHRLVLKLHNKETIAVRDLQGKFRLVHPSTIAKKYASNFEEYTREESSFWCRESSSGPTSALKKLGPEELLLCSTCTRAHEQYKSDADSVASLALDAMDTYSGVGGLSLGIEASCPAIKTKYAIDVNEYPLKTLKMNRPDVEVIHSPVSAIVKQMYDDCEEFEGVEVVLGGFPCQGFSRLNHDKSEEDRRVDEPFNWLACVEETMPLIAIFENVMGIMDYPLPNQVAGEGGLLSLVLENLVNLGYQFQFTTINSAAFGVPQVRNRVFLIASHHGTPLPSMPTPTHVAEHPKGLHFDPAGTGRISLKIARSLGAALPALTVEDAFSDLPAFNLPNPSKRGFNPNLAQKIVGFVEGAKYSSSPKASYQSRMRTSRRGPPSLTEEAKNHIVSGSVTADILCRYHALGIDGIKGMKGNYRDVRKAGLFLDMPANVENKHKNEDFWRRLKPDDVLTTLTTKNNPDGTSQGPRVHYNQARMISITECARAQGFPDSFVFPVDKNDPVLSLTEPQKAIGNAVSLPVAEAIGRQITKMLVELVRTHATSSNTLDCDAALARPRDLARCSRLAARAVGRPVDVDDQPPEEEHEVVGGGNEPIYIVID